MLQRYEKKTKPQPFPFRAPSEFSVCRLYSRDGKYYFCFILPEAKVKRLSDALVHQALSIAQKVDHTILKSKGRKGLVGKTSTMK